MEKAYDRYVLFGSVRIIKDFLYIYRDMKVTNLIAFQHRDKEDTAYQGIKWIEIEELATNENTKIILCMKPGEQREKEVQKLKKRFPKTEVSMCEDYFSAFDDGFSVPENRSVYVWGTGKVAQKLMESNTLPMEPTAFIDSRRSGHFMNKPILNPGNDIINWANAFVIIALEASHEVEPVLVGHGMKKGIDFVRFSHFLYSPSRMLAETFFSEDGYDFSCDTMLNHLEIGPGGQTRVCCTTFMPVNNANFMDKDFFSYWKGDKDILHRILALSTQNRTYVFCKKTMCPLFDSRKNLGAYATEIEQAEYRDIDAYPSVVAVGYDETCNLACETCRKKVYTASKEERAEADSIADKIKKELLQHTDFLIMAGGGEVFLSPSYRRLWEAEETAVPRFFRLLSNGTLFNEAMWERFYKGKERTKIMLTVSIDAASRELYESIRRFGSFDQLKRNMAFAGKLRKEGKLSYFRMNFVVQRKNMHEMVAFSEWGREIGADKVFFTKILNWGTYTQQEFRTNISIMEEDGITPIPELKKILESDALRTSIVDLGTIRYSHQPNNDSYIKNYYIWELQKDVPEAFVTDRKSQ